MKKIMNDIIIRNILWFICYHPYWTINISFFLTFWIIFFTTNFGCTCDYAAMGFIVFLICGFANAIFTGLEIEDDLEYFYFKNKHKYKQYEKNI